MAEKDDILLNVTTELDRKKLNQDVDKIAKELNTKLANSLGNVLSTFGNNVRNTLSSLNNQKITIKIDFDSKEGERRLKERLQDSISRPLTPLPLAPPPSRAPRLLSSGEQSIATRPKDYSTQKDFSTNINPNQSNRFLTNFDAITNVSVTNLAKALKKAIDDAAKLIEDRFDPTKGVKRLQGRLDLIPKPENAKGLDPYNNLEDILEARKGRLNLGGSAVLIEKLEDAIRIKLSQFADFYRKIELGLGRLIEVERKLLTTSLSNKLLPERSSTGSTKGSPLGGNVKPSPSSLSSWLDPSSMFTDPNKLLGTGGPKLLGSGKEGSAPIIKYLENFGRTVAELLQNAVKMYIFRVEKTIKDYLSSKGFSDLDKRLLPPSSKPPIQLPGERQRETIYASGASATSPKLLGPASPKDIAQAEKQIEAQAQAEEKLRKATAKSNVEAEEKKRINAEIANGIAKVTETLKYLETEFGKFGKVSSKSLEKVQNTLSDISKIKPGKDGVYTDAQINKVDGIKNKLDKLGKTLVDLKQKQDKVTSPDIGDKLLGNLEVRLKSASEDLKKFGLTEDQITATTKKAAGGVAFLKEQILLLQDSIKKGDVATAFSSLDKIEKAKPLINTRITTIEQNRNGAVDPLVEKNAKKLLEIDKLRAKIDSNRSSADSTHLDKVNKRLNDQRKIVTDLGVPLVFVNKITRQYDSSLVNIEKNLTHVNREFKTGRITVDQAAISYQKLLDDLRKLKIGIDQINPKRLKEAFDLEEADPRQLSFRLGILAFTLRSIGATLTNFARTAFQGFDQIAQAAEPIERVQNALDLQVRQAQITQEQRDVILARLRNVGDLPGSSVEKANQTFNSLQKVNVSLERRLQLTEGIAKLAASPGGEPGSGEQVTNALLNLANKGGNVDAENFKTLRVQGGKVFSELNASLGLNTAKDLERFGVTNYLQKVADALNKLESPAATTTDRFNRLKSRVSELGVIIGRVLGPGLEYLNDILKRLQSTVDALGKRFDALPESTKKGISTLIVLVPVAIGAIGVLLSAVAALGFALSGLRQIKELGPILKGAFGIGAASASETSAAVVGTVKSVSSLSAAGSNLGKIFKFIFDLAIAPIKIFIGLIKGTPGAVGGIIKSFSSLSNITRVLSGGISGIAGGFAKVLGLTNPVGIAINLILSVFTALWDNFNGIRDRMSLILSGFLKALSSLTSALGLGPGGLMTMLKLLGDALSGIFGFIGEIVLEVLGSLVQYITDIVNNMANLINLIKDGKWMSAILEFVKLLFNAVFGLLKNIVVSLVAGVIDAIASIIEYWMPVAGKTIANGLRSASDTLRTLTGSDKASLERLKQEQAITEEKEKQLVLAEEEKEKEEQRLATIKELKNQLQEITEKAKEDFIKFQFDQAIEKLKLFADTVKESTDRQIESFKDLIGFTSDLNRINGLYAQTLESVRQNQKALIENQSRISLSEALKEFKSQTSASSDFKNIFKLAEQGEESFKKLATAITNAGNSESLTQLRNSLNEVANIANSIDPRLGTFVTNTVEKTQAVIETNARQTQQYIREYRKIINDLKVLEIERRATIEKEIRDAEVERKQRRIDQREKLQEIKDETLKTRAERTGVLEQSVAFQSKEIERRKILNDALKRDSEIRQQIVDIEENYRKQLKLTAEQEVALGDLVGEQRRNEAAEALQNRNKFNQLLQRDQGLQLSRLKTLLAETKTDYLEAERDYQNLFQEQTLNRIEQFFKNIRQGFLNLNDTLLEKLQGLIKKFSTLTYTIGGLMGGIKPSSDTGEEIQVAIVNDEQLKKLRQYLTTLIETTKEVPSLALANLKLKDVLKELINGTITYETALTRVANLLVDIDISDSIEKRVQSQKTLNQLIDDYNSKTGGGNQITRVSERQTEQGDTIVDTQVTAAGRSSVGSILFDLASDNGKNQIENVINVLDIFQKQSQESYEKYLEKYRKQIEDGTFNTEQFFGSLSDAVSYSTELDKTFSGLFDSLLTQLFSSTEDEDILARRLQIIQQAIALYKAVRDEEAARTKATIEQSVKFIDSRSEGELGSITSAIENTEEYLKKLPAMIDKATGNEKNQLIKKQKDLILLLIDLNYKKLDIEESYNIQKSIIQAKGDEEEIKKIKIAGARRRRALQEERNRDIIEAAISAGGSVGKDGKLRNQNGDLIPLSEPNVVQKIGEGDPSADETNKTRPLENVPILSDSEAILANAKAISDAIDGIIDPLNGLINTALQAGNSVLDLFNKIASGEGIINRFKELIGGMKLNMETLGEVFINVAEFAIAAFGQALGQAITDTLLNGGNFLKNLKKFFGDILISMGTQLISMGAIATAIGLLALIPFFSFLDPDHKSLIFGPIAIAAGIAAVLAGKALGGGATAATSNTNATNTANSSAGNTGQVEYDPNKDPKLIYQKGLLTQVLIDIKQDEGSIVKTFIKHSTRDPRLGNIIGNTNKTNFAI